MITSDIVEKMSDEEFDNFQKEERKSLAKQLGIEYSENVILQCGVCKNTFTITSYNNVKCPFCNTIFNFKQSLIAHLKLQEQLNFN